MCGHSNQREFSVVPKILGLVVGAQERAEQREAEAAERAAKAQEEAQRLVQQRRERQAAEEEERRSWQQRRQVCDCALHVWISTCSIELGETRIIWQERSDTGIAVRRTQLLGAGSRHYNCEGYHQVPTLDFEESARHQSRSSCL